MRHIKRIHFDNLNKNSFLTTILILSVIFLFLGIFEFITFENPKINKWITSIGFFLQAIYISRMFWYKNYVQWNKKGVVIRVNSFIAKSLTFEQIITAQNDGEKLVITKSDGKIVSFDLSKIDELDVQKLNEIIINN